MPRPGVYVTESVLPTPVTDATPSVAAGALVAELPSGPTTPVLVNSWYGFTRIFGSLTRDYVATFAANMFFRSGGRELYVARVVRDDADAASASILGDGDDADTELNNAYLTFTAKSVGTYGNELRITVTENAAGLYDITVLQEAGTSGDITDDTVLETFRNLSLTYGNQELLDVINVQSQFVSAAWGGDSSVGLPGTIPTLTLSGGTDGTTSGALDYDTALTSLASLDRLLVLFSPGNTDTDVVSAMVAFAEANRSFVVLDTDEGLGVSGAVDYAGTVGTTSHAAVYAPHIWVPDPTSRSRDAIVKVPPSGAVAGIVLATDASQGVFKAPAGVSASINGVVAVERNYTADELDTLNSDTTPVNAIRLVPGVGPAVMGARTLDQTAATRYVNVRRTLSFLNKELSDRMAFALFRNNDTGLWDASATVLDNFLRGFYLAGGLRGATIADAYYIKIDAENNTESDIAAGIMNVEVGVALQYPAEFIKIKLTQRTQA